MLGGGLQPGLPARSPIDVLAMEAAQQPRRGPSQQAAAGAAAAARLGAASRAWAGEASARPGMLVYKGSGTTAATPPAA